MSPHETITYGDIAKRLSAVSGKSVVTPHLSLETYKSEEYQEKLGPVRGVYNALALYPKDVDRPGRPPREVVPDLGKLEDWAKQDKDLRALLKF